MEMTRCTGPSRTGVSHESSGERLGKAANEARIDEDFGQNEPNYQNGNCPN